MDYIQTLALVVFGHALADYPLQGDFLAKAKNVSAPVTGVPWWQAMMAHSVIHAGFVGVITGSFTIAICEFVAHFAIDYLKCRGIFSYNTDQFLHILCKAVWLDLIIYGVA